MGLSVLIPVYNRDVTLLVTSLATLLTKERIPAEIVLLDDASEPEYDKLNQQLEEGDFIFYFRNDINLGRSLTRKMLAEKAKYTHLLFLDCDIKIAGPDFISKYTSLLKDNPQVCCGGLVYDNGEPDDCEFRLHWRYGKFRESKRAAEEGIFLSSNFLIRKNLFLTLPFETPLLRYGHEDTLWGIELKKKNISLIKIDNPVMHEGLEESSIYLKKSLQAVENLVVLETMVGADVLAGRVKLYRAYKKLDAFFATGLVSVMEKWFHTSVMKNLQSCNPSLKYFDWYRLAHLIRLKKKTAK